MILSRTAALLTLTLTFSVVAAQDAIDRLGDSLSFSVSDDAVRGRLSGMFSLEYYRFDGAPQGLIFTDGRDLLNPRFTLFFDAQLGPQIYLFAQSRTDHGFDPSNGKLQTRLDEWAVRWTPWHDGRFVLQAGQVATIMGNYVERHLAWENPFVTAPLMYEQITPIYDSEAPATASEFTRVHEGDSYEYNPVIWGPVYTSGISMAGKVGKVDFAAELKNAGPSSRPEEWGIQNRGMDHPTVTARIGYKPNMAWKLGLSGSQGAYLTEHAAPTLPTGTGINDYQQQILAQDISFAWKHWQLWAEVYEARFQVPRVGDADVLGYYVEAKYKVTPQLFAALRWNQMHFGSVTDGAGDTTRWSPDVWRADAAVTWRATAHTQLKFQYSLQKGTTPQEDLSHLLAAQFTIKF